MSQRPVPFSVQRWLVDHNFTLRGDDAAYEMGSRGMEHGLGRVDVTTGDRRELPRVSPDRGAIPPPWADRSGEPVSRVIHNLALALERAIGLQRVAQLVDDVTAGEPYQHTAWHRLQELLERRAEAVRGGTS